jgi:protein-disulfide isomerase
VRGNTDWPLVVVYADFTCPRCALAHARLAQEPLRVAFRHFALAAKHPRSLALAAAVQAAGLQGRFWELHDALFADPAHTDDPHLWAYAGELGLDLERFERERRSAEVHESVREQTRAGIRAGVVVTPTLLALGAILPGVPDDQLIARLTGRIN